MNHMMDKERFDKMFRLNEELASTSSPERQKEIEKEIISLVPKDLYVGGPEVVKLAQMQLKLKEKIEKMRENLTSHNLTAYTEEVEELAKKIQAYAETLGASIPNTNYGNAIKKTLETRFKDEDK